MQTAPQAYTVTAITRLIKSTLEQSFDGIWVEGEISNYHFHSSGHRYFNLKDNRAVLKVTLWRSLGARLKFEPEDGQKVLVYGDITVYERGGQYQLNCKRLLPVGVGELELAFRQLYEKLQAEGLFDEANKQPLPSYPTRIGIVTSPTGAAIRDIIQVSRRRNPGVELIIYPAAVQGAGAEKTIVAGIEYFNSRDDIDVIITGRGGGSLEDLWAFNTEPVVRAIAASRIPVVSAVGHEVDTTLSDLVADLRAPTPSAAAELVVWSRREYLEQGWGFVAAQSFALQGFTRHARQRLRQLISRPVFVHPETMVNERRQYLDHQVRLMVMGGKNRFAWYRNRLSLQMSRLEALSPLNILARGYSVTKRLTDGEIVRRTEQAKIGDELEITVSDGRLKARAEEVMPSKRAKA